MYQGIQVFRYQVLLKRSETTRENLRLPRSTTRALPGSIREYQGVIKGIRHYQALPGTTRNHQGTTREYKALPGSAGEYQEEIGSSKEYHQSSGSTRSTM